VLRREVVGARLAAVEATAGDRVVTLRLERGGRTLSLVAELTGRHGNLFLVGEGGAVVASAARNLSQRRRLVPGEPYEAPAPREVEEEGSRFGGPGPGPGAGRGTPAAPAPAAPAPVPDVDFPISAAVEEDYERREAARALAEARRRVRDPLRAALGRMRRALDRLAEEVARVPAADADRRAGDLLKHNLLAVRRGDRRVTLTEWTEAGSREVTLDLDPALGPHENMERYYRRCRRIVESAARVEARAAEVRARLASVQELLATLEAADAPAITRIEREARRLGAAPRPAPQPVHRGSAARPKRAGFRTFLTAGSLQVLVGKGAAENDELTVRVARGNDLWLHVRGIAGAHVVLRLEKGRGPDQESLLDAAHLAAWFGGARDEPATEVVYTRAKFVRKPRGSAPGVVTYSQERTLSLRIEPARIERLLQTEDATPEEGAR
jgi:predicted ribosome quality control (RQC) complex YloA/Tae2 family protein